MSIRHKVGSFAVAGQFAREAPDELLVFFLETKVLVVGAEIQIFQDRIIYIVLGDVLREIKEGEIIPEYQVIVNLTKEADGTYTRTYSWQEINKPNDLSFTPFRYMPTLNTIQ